MLTRAARSSTGQGGEVIENGISVVIPAYNEADRLPSTLDRLLCTLPATVLEPWEIIVSDDGSDDGTCSLAGERGSAVRVLRSATNRGKGAAQVAGARVARYSNILFLDADLPVPVETIAEMMVLAGTADLVCASRRLPGSRSDPPQPLLRRVGGRGFRLVIAALGFDATSDPQCGVKLLRRDTVVPVLEETSSSGFAFDVELIVAVRRRGLRVVEVPVLWRHVPGSSLRPFRDALRTVNDLVRLRRAEMRRRGSADRRPPLR